MKKSQIVLIVLIAVVIGTFIATFTGSSTSVAFAEAFQNPGKEFKVSGTLNRDHPVSYDPEVNVELTTFHMKDKEGNTREVKLQMAKPTGLEQSETIDLYGTVVDGEFIASDMLMKCPSKYNEQNHAIETTADASNS